eukprot:scaffold80573_cov55-Phaeocystis_antarctica.AAC.2
MAPEQSTAGRAALFLCVCLASVGRAHYCEVWRVRCAVVCGATAWACGKAPNSPASKEQGSYSSTHRVQFSGRPPRAARRPGPRPPRVAKCIPNNMRQLIECTRVPLYTGAAGTVQAELLTTRDMTDMSYPQSVSLGGAEVDQCAEAAEEAAKGERAAEHGARRGGGLGRALLGCGGQGGGQGGGLGGARRAVRRRLPVAEHAAEREGALVPPRGAGAAACRLLR